MWEQKKETKPECVKTCGRQGEEELIYIDYYVMGKINFLMKKYPDLEWLAYLIGRDNIVEDFYIPKQKVTATNVCDIEADPEVAIIGVIHSHHHLGLHSFSGTDHAYINDNHDLSILVWHGGMNGQKKVKLPCGSIMIVPIRVEFFHPDINTTDLEKEADENISEKTYVYTQPTGGGYLAPGYGGGYVRNEAEKKTESGGNSCENRNVVTGKNDYEDYLDQLVFDDQEQDQEQNFPEICAEDRTPLDVEEHFQRIESRECGIQPKLPRFAGEEKIPRCGVGAWEV
jgi:hypothetical protein